MGMGEPMDNFDQVIRSILILNDRAGKNIGQRRITVSTCGITEGIERLAKQQLQVRLAVSLHSADDQIRQMIMAVAKTCPLKALIESVRNYQRQTRRRVTFEYCLIKGLNDSMAQARGVVKLVASTKSHVNLIEYNPHSGCEFTGSSQAQIQRFAQVLKEAGIETSIRYKRGRKIKAACGQLAVKSFQT